MICHCEPDEAIECLYLYPHQIARHGAFSTSPALGSRVRNDILPKTDVKVAKLHPYGNKFFKNTLCIDGV